MNLIVRLLSLITLLLTCYPIYSSDQQLSISPSKNKAYEVIESKINNSALYRNIAQPSVTWLGNDNGAVAVIEYKNKKIEIPFSLKEMNSAAQGYIAPKTKIKINKVLNTLPPGGGPLP